MSLRDFSVPSGTAALPSDPARVWPGSDSPDRSTPFAAGGDLHPTACVALLVETLDWQPPGAAPPRATFAKPSSAWQ